MQYSTAVSDAVLALACLLSIGAIVRSLWPLEKNQRATWFCVFAALALTANAAVVGVLHFGLDESWQPLHAKLSQASSLLALPILGVAALALARGWWWQRLGWCWVIITLSLAFEGAQRVGMGDTYKLLLNLFTLVLLLYAGVSQLPRSKAPLLQASAVVALFIVAGLVVGTQGEIGPLHRVDVFHALLSLAYPLLAWLLLGLRSNSVRAVEIAGQKSL